MFCLQRVIAVYAVFKAAFEFVTQLNNAEKESISSTETPETDSEGQVKMFTLGLSFKGMLAAETSVC